jgi:hypothetical protein
MFTHHEAALTWPLNPIAELLANGEPQTRRWRIHFNFSIGRAFLRHPTSQPSPCAASDGGPRNNSYSTPMGYFLQGVSTNRRHAGEIISGQGLVGLTRLLVLPRWWP